MIQERDHLTCSVGHSRVYGFSDAGLNSGSNIANPRVRCCCSGELVVDMRRTGAVVHTNELPFPGGLSQYGLDGFTEPFLPRVVNRHDDGDTGGLLATRRRSDRLGRQMPRMAQPFANIDRPGSLERRAD